jgi:alanyl-tRNA synthetase
MAQTLGIEEPILVDVAAQVRDLMEDSYPEVRDQAALTDNILRQEEERFRRTLSTGHAFLEQLIVPRLAGELAAGDSVEISGARSLAETIDRVLAELPDDAAAEIPGEIGFILYDTYGFPPELTREVAAQHGLGFDQSGFDAAMEAQRERGRASADFRVAGDAAVYASIDGRSQFSGYDATADAGNVIGLVADGEALERAEAGREIEVILSRTAFYAEGGGQQGDVGVLRSEHGEVRVHDTQARGDLIAHIGEVVSGHIAVGDEVQAEVELERRQGLMRNHTATHLLHAALRSVLGDHVRQAGSLVAPDRLRFDYTQPEQPDATQMAEVERLVAARIRDDIPVQTNEMAYEDALEIGATAIFGEKYATEVRVVEICDPDPHVHACFSKELCGGVHAPATGFIGGFKIISEGSVGAGLRRIEALTGAAADAWQRQRLDALNEVADLLRTTPLEAAARLEAMRAELDQARRRLAEVERQASAGSAATLAEQVQEIDGVQVVAGEIQTESADGLREAGDEIKRRLGSGVVVLGAVANDRPLFIAMVTDDLTKTGLHAGNIIREVAKLAGGGGGGKPHMAQAGGKDASKLGDALGAVPGIVAAQRGG